MPKKMNIVLMVVAFLFAGQTLAQGQIAIVDAERAIYETELAKERLEAMKNNADVVANLKQGEALQKEFEDMVKKLQKDGAVMGAEQKAELQKKLQEKRADIEHIGKKLQATQQELRRQLLSEMGEKAKVVISDIIKQDNIGLLLDAQVALHAGSGYDITAKVTQRLNENN